MGSRTLFTWLAYVSALEMSAPTLGLSIQPVTLDFIISEGDPKLVELHLVQCTRRTVNIPRVLSGYGCLL